MSPAHTARVELCPKCKITYQHKGDQPPACPLCAAKRRIAELEAERGKG